MSTLPNRPRSDALPEYSDYADSGCDLAPSCLSCPLPQCRYDVPGGKGAIERESRYSLIRHYAGQGLKVDEIATICGVSRRTVFRVLSADKPERAAQPAVPARVQTARAA